MSTNTYQIEAISNGFIVTNALGVKEYHADITDFTDALGVELLAWVRDMRRHEWDGRFELAFGFQQTPLTKS